MTQAQTARFPILQATAWRIAAELFRRHANRYRLLLSSVHPGSSTDGCLLIQFQTTDQQPPPSRALMLALGGPDDVRGQYFLELALSRGADFVTPMLSERPYQLIDELDAQLGLRTPVPLPPSTDEVLAMRCIAELLERQGLARHVVRAMPAYWEYNGEVHIHAWMDPIHPDLAIQRAAFTAASSNTDAARAWATQFVALRVEKDGAPHAGPESKAPIAVFHLGQGTVSFIRNDALMETVAIRPSYVAHGRSLNALVTQVLTVISG